MKAICLSLSLAAFSASASQVGSWSINAGLLGVSPKESSSYLNVVESVAGLPANSAGVTVNSNTQLGLIVDYQYSKDWSFSLVAATPFSHDIKVSGSAIDGLAIGNTKHLPPTLFANYHLPELAGFIQPFIGAGLNYTIFFSEDVDSELRQALTELEVITNSNQDLSLKLDNSFGLAWRAGMNLKLTDSWGAHLMLSQIDIDTTGQVQLDGSTIQSVDVAIDPLVWMAGVRYSF